MWIDNVWAAGATAASPSLLENFFPFILIFVVFYFFLIRPQQKKQRLVREMISQLKKGDSVLTNAGILGSIEGITEKFVTLEVSEGVRLRILKSHIASLINGEEIK